VNAVRLISQSLDLPERLNQVLKKTSAERVTAIGNIDILNNRLLALFCSNRCPGKVILRTQGMANRWRNEGVTVVSGFHSPLEREVLRILGRGSRPIVVCPARSIEAMRIRPEYRQPLAEGRLLFLSPFEQTVRRITVESSVARNRFVASLADEIFIAYAAPGSKTEALCRELASGCKPFHTLDTDSHS
jgi:predicted Rossmann fold nucleotide-binding protein DprA/Smf involved in DNA uptake